MGFFFLKSVLSGRWRTITELNIFFSGLEKWLKLLYPNMVRHSGGAYLQEF